MKLSLRQAAHETGVAKSTISRAIKSGKLSAERLEDGGFAIDPSELFRVYPPKPVARNDAPVSVETFETMSDNMLLAEQVEALRETVRRLDDQVADLREDRDRWRMQSESATRLLTDLRPRETPIEVPPVAAASAPVPVKEGLITRLAKAFRG
jgi:hypothetical protein